MKILVLGGSYFLGKYFVNMARDIHQITVFNRGNRALDGEDILQVVGDRHDASALQSLGRMKFDAIVDFCAYEEGDIASVFEALGGNVKQYIFISTCDVYEHGTGRLMDETTTMESIRFPGERGDYISGKVALEKELDECGKKYDVSVTSIRPAMIYGPDNYAPRESLYFKWIYEKGEIIHPSDATGEFQFTFVGDVSRAVLAALGNEEAYNQAYNLATTEIDTYDYFADALEQVLQKPLKKQMLSVNEIAKQKIQLPFPLILEISNCYDGRKALSLIGQYTDLVSGLEETLAYYEAQNGIKLRAGSSTYQAYVDEIERLFEENKPKEAERLMLEVLEEARKTEDASLELQMLNELIGYYRQTSEKDHLLTVIKAALEIADKRGLAKTDTGKIPYATTLLNAANGYRSIGELDQSEIFYKRVQAIYEEALDETDMLFAGLYNNMSLLLQEKRDYVTAMEYQEKALAIVTANQAGFETAVTYANLANTAILAGDMTQANKGASGSYSASEAYYAKAKDYAKKAMRVFGQRNTFDAHYCAALSALAHAYKHEGKYQKAYELLRKAMRIVENTLGHNSQYLRLKESCEACEEKAMNGMKLSKLYYEECGKPILQEKFGAYFPKLTIGLVGEGSDCFGYDDEASMDHDWGPDFCIFVPDELYEEIGPSLTKVYEELPKEFRGYKRKTGKQGIGRRGVMSVSAFYEKYLGTAVYEKIDWRQIPDYALAAASNGVLFENSEGAFSKMREQLKKGYPEEILYLKLAEDAARISQTGQYNFKRMLEREDRITADQMLADCMRQIMILAHHMNQVFPPHDKWIYRSFEEICGETPLAYHLLRLHDCLKLNDEEAMQEEVERVDAVCAYLAGELYARNYISDVEAYLDYHTEELIQKASFAACSNEELIQKIVLEEKKAFCEVCENSEMMPSDLDIQTFEKLRMIRFADWDRLMLFQYLYDFLREQALGHNLVEEKYNRMAQELSGELAKGETGKLPLLSEQKRTIAEQIAALQASMAESKSTSASEEKGPISFELDLKCELYTYSDKMLQLYGQHVVACLQ